MRVNGRHRLAILTPRRLGLSAVALTLLVCGMLWLAPHAAGGPPCRTCPRVCPTGPCVTCDECNNWAGTWYWLRSPDEERRAVAGLYNRYCIRCHGVDGRGVWDIPDVPNFTNVRWQACRTDAQLARIILEGRGAVMPPFRGTFSLEEACAMARYLRTFVPGTEKSRPDFHAVDNPVAK